MSVSSDIETEYRTNVLTVPLASVTTRPVTLKKMDPQKNGETNSASTNLATVKTPTNMVVSKTSGTNAAADTNALASGAKGKEGGKPTDVVFIVNGDHVEAAPVKIGICDDNFWEITDGLTNGQEIVSGGYRAISRELQDGSKIRKGAPTAEVSKK
jgi:HlyD family secretion protein